MVPTRAIALAATLQQWFHRMRWKTAMSEDLEVMGEVSESILNHSKKDMDKVYNNANYLKQKLANEVGRPRIENRWSDGERGVDVATPAPALAHSIIWPPAPSTGPAHASGRQP
jgi:hypothetical protein